MSILSQAHFHNEEAAYEFVEKRIWPHGFILDDDRQKNVSVDEAVMKMEYKVSDDLIMHLSPRFNKRDAWNMFLIVGMMFLLIGMIFVPAITGVSVPALVSNGLTLLMFAFLFLFIRFARLFGLKLSCQTAVLEQRCGACLSDLQGLIPEPDGCVVCPECGGAWNLHRCPDCAKLHDSIDADSCPECGWKRP